jgi:hypothetical protein
MLTSRLRSSSSRSRDEAATPTRARSPVLADGPGTSKDFAQIAGMSLSVSPWRAAGAMPRRAPVAHCRGGPMKFARASGAVPKGSYPAMQRRFTGDRDRPARGRAAHQDAIARRRRCKRSSICRNGSPWSAAPSHRRAGAMDFAGVPDAALQGCVRSSDRSFRRT